MQEPILRRAGPDDAETVAALGAATFAETFGHLYPPADLAGFLAAAHSVARARADLTDPESALWLLEAAGAAVGYVLAGPCGLPHPEASPDDGEIKRLYLLQSAQNGGWGGRLFEAALAWLQARGPRAGLDRRLVGELRRAAVLRASRFRPDRRVRVRGRRHGRPRIHLEALSGEFF